MSTTEINIIMKQERERPLLSSPSEVGSTTTHVPIQYKIMRRTLQFVMIISIILFITPLIFFVLGVSNSVGEFARISRVIANNDDDTDVKDIFEYPSVKELCTNKADCIRFVYILLYLIVFTMIYVFTVILFAKRKNELPLRSRSCYFVSFFVISSYLWVVWAAIGLMYAPSWLGCNNTHLFNNVMYPMLLLPYFFRAWRIKKIYDVATLEYDKNILSEYTSKKISIVGGPTHNSNSQDLIMNNKYTNTSVQKPGSQFINTKKNPSFDENELRTRTLSAPSMSSMTRNDSIGNDTYGGLSKANKATIEIQQKLLYRFLFCLVPFLLISVVNYFHDYHMIPTFIKNCDYEYRVSSIVIWIIIHIFEVLLFFYTVYMVRDVWKAFSVKQELMLICIINVIFCVSMIAFGPTKKLVDDGVIVLYLILMRAIGFYLVSIIYPLYQTYFSMSYLPDIPTQDVITSLKTILDDINAAVYFRAFMTDQSFQHLLDFWIEIDLFKDAITNNELNDEQLKSEAINIFRKYFDINNNSANAIGIRNIVNKMNKKYIKNLNKFINYNSQTTQIKPNIFDIPQKCVFEHMENVHYRLFLRTQHCKRLLANVQTQEAIFRKLINEQIL